MKMTVDVELNLNIDKVTKEVIEANREAMRDTVISITNDAVKLSPYQTGHNRRSIAGETSGFGAVAQGSDASIERIVNDSKIEGAVYSTSGYGGFLETGTSKMPGRPYFKPSLDMNFSQDKFAERVKRHLK